MHYREVSIKSIIEENASLVSLHWSEVTEDQPGTELRISDDKYIWLEDNNHLKSYGVYSGPLMVGYCVWLVNTSLHSGDLQAVNDCIYIHPKYRSKGLAKKLIESSEIHLIELGVKHIGISMKSYSRFEGLVTSLGYDLTELQYSKHIG